MTRVPAQPTRTDRAFERLYRRNVRHVYGYALAVLRSPEDAEDVTQATFLNAYRALERGERPRPLDSWLIAIAHKLCDQRARQEARRERVAYEDQSHEAVPEDDGPSPSGVSRGLRRLPFDQRAALIMREVEGRGYPELAHIFGSTVGDVETLLFRARRALREELEGGLTCHLAERAISRRLDGLLVHERELAVSASHELRTPVTALRLELEDLALWPEVTPPVAAELHRCVAELDRVEAAISGLLARAASRRASDEVEVDLDALLTEAVARRADPAVTHRPSRATRTRVAPGANSSVRSSMVESKSSASTRPTGMPSEPTYSLR